MKKLLCLFVAAALLAGCDQKSSHPDIVNDSKITWWTDSKSMVLFVQVGTLQTNINVSSLDGTLSVANQYGWKYISSERGRYSETYHIQRIGKESSYIILLADTKQ